MLFGSGVTVSLSRANSVATHSNAQARSPPHRRCARAVAKATGFGYVVRSHAAQIMPLRRPWRALPS